MNANENMNPVTNAEAMQPEQPVAAPITEPAQPVMNAQDATAPVEEAPIVDNMPPLPSNPDPLAEEDMTAAPAPEAAPVDEDPSAPVDEAPIDAAALEAQLQQQRSQSQHRRTGPQARPLRFAANRQNVVHRADPNFQYVDLEEQKRKRAALDLYQSYNSSRYLQGCVKGVKPVFDRRSGVDNDNMLYYAIVSYGPYQVYIPDFKFSDMDQNELLAAYRVNNPNCTMADAMRVYLQSRLGAEVDFIVDQLPDDGDLDNNFVVGGSRSEAMRRKRIQFWYGTTSTGAPYVNEDELAAARIVAVSRAAVRIELYGVECTIPARELSWSMIQDAREDPRFEAGKLLMVRITKITRNQEKDYAVSFQASVKRAEPDRRIAAMQVYTVGFVTEGYIRYIEPPRQDHPNGRVFVELEQGVQCMCPMLSGSIPPLPGAKVRVRITNRNEERHFLFATIERVVELPTNIKL